MSEISEIRKDSEVILDLEIQLAEARTHIEQLLKYSEALIVSMHEKGLVDESIDGDYCNLIEVGLSTPKQSLLLHNAEVIEMMLESITRDMKYGHDMLVSTAQCRKHAQQLREKAKEGE